MRAAYIEEFGPPDAIRYGELPVPRMGSTDVLVDVTATTVNPVDTYVRSGALHTWVDFPFVTGRDLVGTVADVGPGCTGFAVGDRVWCNSLGHDGRQGAAAEQAVVAADRLYRLPDGVDPEVAVAMADPGAIAYRTLFTHGMLRPGETVVVIGAGDDLGRALVAFAARAGARVIATADAQDVEYGASLGAAEVFDRRCPELVRKIRGTSPDGVDLYVDTAGVNTVRTTVGLLAPRGRAVLLAGALAKPVVPASVLFLERGSVVGFSVVHAPAAELAEAAAGINRLLAAGLLCPRATEVLPLSATAEAHRRVGQQAPDRRQVILRPDSSMSPSGV
ncbi:NADPH:quinone reductase [Streptomyces sp. NPDC002851]